MLSRKFGSTHLIYANISSDSQIMNLAILLSPTSWKTTTFIYASREFNHTFSFGRCNKGHYRIMRKLFCCLFVGVICTWKLKKVSALLFWNLKTVNFMLSNSSITLPLKGALTVIVSVTSVSIIETWHKTAVVFGTTKLR